MRVSLVALVGVFLSGMVLANLTATTRAQDAVVHEGSNVGPNPGDVGEKPYEMIGRQEARTPLVTFEECTQCVTCWRSNWSVGISRRLMASFRAESRESIGL